MNPDRSSKASRAIGLKPLQSIALMVLFCATANAATDTEQSSSPQPVENAASSAGFGGPDSIPRRSATDRNAPETRLDLGLLNPWYAWRDKQADERGLTLNAEYNVTYLSTSDELEDTSDDSFGGIFRFSGSWSAFGRETSHPGTVRFLVEHTNSYTNTPPSGFLGQSTGYAGISNLPYNDEGWRLNTLYWDQIFQDGKYELVAGYLDISDYVDVFPLVSPWTDFFNYSFSIGAGALDLANDGALGVAGATWLTESIYATVGLVDQNSDATDPLDGFDTFFNDHEFFKHVEIGWTGASQEAWYLNNVHLTLWQADERDELGVQDGWGGVLSFNHTITDQWLVFVRGGFAEDGGSLLERSVSIGAGYTPAGIETLGSGSQLGFGATWGRPNDALFGENLDDQYALETYFRLHVSRELAITPSVQLLIDPALNPDKDSVWVAGIRARFAI